MLSLSLSSAVLTSRESGLCSHSQWSLLGCVVSTACGENFLSGVSEGRPSLVRQWLGLSQRTSLRLTAYFQAWGFLRESLAGGVRPRQAVSASALCVKVKSDKTKPSDRMRLPALFNPVILYNFSTLRKSTRHKQNCFTLVSENTRSQLVVDHACLLSVPYTRLLPRMQAERGLRTPVLGITQQLGGHTARGVHQR